MLRPPCRVTSEVAPITNLTMKTKPAAIRPVVRRMAAGDHPAVCALWRVAGLTDEPEDAATDFESFLLAPQSAGFIAEHAGIVIGAVLCGTDGRYGYVHHLAVSPAHRKAGIGRMLTQACIRQLGTRHVLIMVRDTNEPARAFWGREGFQRVDGLSVHYVSNAKPGLQRPAAKPVKPAANRRKLPSE